MTTRRVPHLSEVANKRVHLTTVVRHERDHPLDTIHLGLLAPLKTVDEQGEQLIPR